MTQFTKEQLIERGKQEFGQLKQVALLFPESQLAAMDVRLAEIALAALTAEPLAWTDDEELRDIERGRCGYMFTCKPVTPHADERRVIKLYRLPLLEGLK